MSFLEHFINAIRSIKVNKTRTLLSSLWIIIGVASVIVLLAFGEWAQESITSNIKSLGTNLLTLRVWGSKQGDVRATNQKTSNIFTTDDTDAIKKIDWVSAVSPVVSSSKQVIVWSTNGSTTVYWVSPEYSTIKNLKMQYGSFISKNDVTEGKKVAVLGPTTVSNFFWTGSNPLWETIKVGNVYLQIVWVTEAKGSSGMQNTDDAIYIPISTMQSRFVGNKYVSQFVIMATSESVMDSTKEAITNYFLKKLKITDSSNATFSVSSSSEMLSTMTSVTDTLKLFLWGIAAISLVVWGIGIMNIMLVSVSERTREIGIRRSIWALDSDIIIQFLAESIVLTFLWWVIGIGLSYGIVKLASLFSVSAIITSSSIVLSAGSSIAIGVVFGFLPAYKAAKLKPIDALRFD